MDLLKCVRYSEGYILRMSDMTRVYDFRNATYDEGHILRMSDIARVYDFRNATYDEGM
ncbi:MAG: hypothetical protein RSD22_06375 [Romboutsia sp.]